MFSSLNDGMDEYDLMTESVKLDEDDSYITVKLLDGSMKKLPFNGDMISVRLIKCLLEEVIRQYFVSHIHFMSCKLL